MQIPIEKCAVDKTARRQLIIIQKMEKQTNKNLQQQQKQTTKQLVSNQLLCWRETTEAKIHRILDNPHSELQNKIRDDRNQIILDINQNSSQFVSIP